MPFAPRATPEASAPEGARGQPEIVQPASLDPSRPGGSPAGEPMSLERYVAISAELATGDQGEVLARLGVTRDAWVAAMHEMAKRFKSESGLEARYRALMRERLGHGRTPPTT